MLLRMLPDQIKDHWVEIKPAIYEALPVYTGERSSLMNDILVGILTEEILVWISYQLVEGKQVIDAICTTKFTFNGPTKSLLLYTVYGYAHIPEESWIEAFDAMTTFGKANDCDNILAYTDNPEIIKYGEMFKARMTTLLTFPIGG